MSRGRDRDDTREQRVISGLSSDPRNETLEDARDDSLSRAGGGSTSSDPRDARPDDRRGRDRRHTRDIIRIRSRDYSVSREDLSTLEQIGKFRILDTSDPAVKRHLAREAARRRERLARTLRSARVDLVRLATDRPYDLPLVRYFEERARRAR